MGPSLNTASVTERTRQTKDADLPVPTFRFVIHIVISFIQNDQTYLTKYDKTRDKTNTAYIYISVASGKDECITVILVSSLLSNTSTLTFERPKF